MSIEVVPYRRLTTRERRELDAVSERYGRFVGSTCRADLQVRRR
jgi:hypothetical protein